MNYSENVNVYYIDDGVLSILLKKYCCLYDHLIESAFLLKSLKVKVYFSNTLEVK